MAEDAGSDEADLRNAFAVAEETEETPEADDEDDMDFDEGPVASSAVSEAVAMANEPDDPSEEIDAEEVRRQIWDVAGDANVVRDPADRQADGIVNVATAVTGRAGRSAGRVKTRLLGFQGPDSEAPDVFETAKTATSKTETKFPVGWIIVIEGPGRGTCFTMFNGVSQIGRGEDQAVRLDFGDTSISRNNHAAVAYDDEQAKFFLGHGGKSNLVRLNGRPVLSTEELSNGDTIRIGETTLKFVSLCDENFSWKNTDGEDAEHGENA
ncbi:FHA domain-containing protein [Alphaproteobacteria bacterium GH1-50]|uniref:FHA domain-containing protein n=2 Tax=Kangsaoukella pontilimi TaxID=2691042 RepID=A0A7C9MI65_9RHOB|nr:FHA domain-containing protein [Kangsaoukella pontilimi]